MFAAALSVVAARIWRVTSICALAFPDGWVVRLRAMYTQATYAGHLEGAITARRNDEIVRKLMRKADELFGFGYIPTHLIEPARTTGTVIEGFSESGRQVRRESLPPVACIGVLDADAVPGADGCASSLIIVWFQQAPAPVPIEADLVDLLVRIPWDELAASYWF